MAPPRGPAPPEKLRAYSTVDPETGCWNWQRTILHNGYGQICTDGRGSKARAHRVSYEVFKGPIPAGLQIDHLCRNRRCVNPEHLEVVTPRENVMRGVGLTSINARKTHCRRGHEFTPENTRISLGKRYCRACARAQDALRGTRPKGPKYYAEHPNVRRPTSIGAA